MKQLILVLIATFLTTSTITFAESAKCGQNKCGASKQKKQAPQYDDNKKCGEGKCGEAKKNALKDKCGQGKETTPKHQCGQGKCG